MQLETRQTFTNVWDAIEDTPSEAQRMKLKSALMIEISEYIRQKGWDKILAAKECNVTIPRIEDLLRGRINNFTIDSLINIVASLGRRINISVE